ncbi:MAG: aminoacyl-tRNA hydrolase [Candidatus Hodarchaeales archaeon]|jgi:PTH2 family peptidyl-tRNA hydrolase
MKVKQVIVIRKDLNMRTGKLAAQVAHASMAVLLDKMERSPVIHDVQGLIGVRYTLNLRDKSPIYQWLNDSFVKIVVYVNSLEDLLVLRDNAESIKIPTALITDAGRTEFHGKPTVTALAIGPDKAEKIDKVTGDLPLL